MPPPIAVDLAQLSRLATDAQTTADALTRLSATVPRQEPDGAAVYGDTDAAPALQAFQARWSTEATLAAEAAEEFADGLRHSASAYHSADEAALHRMRAA